MSKSKLKKGIAALSKSKNAYDLKEQITGHGQVQGNNGYLVLDISKIKTGKNNPRKEFDNEYISELSQSIKDHGLLQPIIIDQDYNIIAGESRYRACKKLKLSTVKVTINDKTGNDAVTASIIENIQRKDLSAKEVEIAC